MLHSFSLVPIRIVIRLEFWLSELGSISCCLLEFCFGFIHLFSSSLFFCPLLFGADSVFWNFQPNNWTSYQCPWKHSSPVWVHHCRSLLTADVPSGDIVSTHSHSVAFMFSCWPPHLSVVLAHALKMFSMQIYITDSFKRNIACVLPTACISGLLTKPDSRKRRDCFTGALCSHGFMWKEIHLTPDLSSKVFMRLGDSLSGVSARCLFKADSDLNIKLQTYISTWKNYFEKRKILRHE